MGGISSMIIYYLVVPAYRLRLSSILSLDENMKQLQAVRERVLSWGLYPLVLAIGLAITLWVLGWDG